MRARFARWTVVGGVVAALLVSALAPALASVPCFQRTACCPCAQAKTPATPTVQSSCCCVAESPDGPAPPPPASLPVIAAASELAGPPTAALLPDPFPALPTAQPAPTSPTTGPDPPPVWLLTTSFRR